MKVDTRYSYQESKIFFDFSITPVVKVKLSDTKTGLSSTGYGDNAENAKENAFNNLKIKEDNFSGRHFAFYDAKGKTISSRNSGYHINQRV